MTNPIAQAARIKGGKLQTEHSHLCGTRRGADCHCSPTYSLKRTPRRGGKRR